MDQTTETGAALKRSAGDAKEEVKNLAAEAKQQARGLIDEKASVAKDALTEQLVGVARAIRTASGELPNASVQGPIASLADGIERVAGSIQSRDLGSAVRDVEGFARRQPALFIGGCVAIGFALSRFLKASESKQSYDVDTTTWGQDEELGLSSLSHEQMADEPAEPSWDEPLGVTR